MRRCATRSVDCGSSGAAADNRLCSVRTRRRAALYTDTFFTLLSRCPHTPHTSTISSRTCGENRPDGPLRQHTARRLLLPLALALALALELAIYCTSQTVGLCEDRKKYNLQCAAGERQNKNMGIYNGYLVDSHNYVANGATAFPRWLTNAHIPHPALSEPFLRRTSTALLAGCSSSVRWSLC